MKIGVSEIFYSIQGEGPSAGRPAVFLRLGGCNLLCGGAGTDKDKRLHNDAKWRCDTIEVWQNPTNFTIEDLYSKLQNEGYLAHLTSGAHLIITGGEPLLWQRHLVEFCSRMLFVDQPYVEVETNGTILPSPEFTKEVNQFNVSPKLSNSGMDYAQRVNAEALRYFVSIPNAFFKFVIAEDCDIAEMRQLTEQFHIPEIRTWLMPAASDREELNDRSAMVAAYCKTFKYNFSSRLQLSIWDKATGV